MSAYQPSKYSGDRGFARTSLIMAGLPLVRDLALPRPHTPRLDRQSTQVDGLEVAEVPLDALAHLGGIDGADVPHARDGKDRSPA